MPHESPTRPAIFYDVLVCGSLNLDLVSQVPYLPAAGETLPASHLSRLPGGKGLNQAVAAARQGACVTLLGATGQDADAALLRHVMDQEGLSQHTVRALEHVPTGLAVIHVADDAENVIVIHGGANRAVTAAQISADMAAAKVYLAQLEVPIEALQVFFGEARQRGGVCMLNAAPAEPAAIQLLKDIDILIVNETELRMLVSYVAPSVTESTHPDGDDASLARHLIDGSLHTVIVTVGERGAWMIDKDTATRVPAPAVKAVDTTGAGDCFCGVLAAALAEHRPIADAVQCAVAAAAESVQSIGAISALPSRR